MKVATLTFHRALNYGAVLQTYALQKKLLDLGYDTCVLDYRSNFIEEHYKPDNICNYLSVKGLAVMFFRNGFSIVRRNQFEPFLKKYVIISNKYDETNICESENEYDMFCVGSDQVWNYRTAGFDKIYFLNFVNASSKKKSYAASIGLDSIPKEYEKEYKELLQSFSKISVREQEGTALVNSLLNRNIAVTVLDPTLLIEANDWECMEEKTTTPSKYILVYLLSENRKILKFAKKLSRKKGYDILYINNQLFSVFGMKNMRKITPQKWIYLFRNADYIITNSFHGTVFSIIFNKIFWCDYLPTSGNVNSRITTLLGSLGLKNRIIGEGCSYQDDSIKYDEVNKKLEVLKKESIDFLKQLSEEEKNE